MEIHDLRCIFTARVNWWTAQRFSAANALINYGPAFYRRSLGNNRRRTTCRLAENKRTVFQDHRYAVSRYQKQKGSGNSFLSTLLYEWISAERRKISFVNEKHIFWCHLFLIHLKRKKVVERKKMISKNYLKFSKYSSNSPIQISSAFYSNNTEYILLCTPQYWYFIEKMLTP